MKQVTVLVCCLALHLWLGAQPITAQFGARGGVNLSDLVGADVEEADARAGLAGGFGVSLLTLGPLSLSPELYYIQKGAGSAQLLAESPEMFDAFGLDYVEIPVLVRLGFPLPFGDGRFRGYAEGGPAFAWRVNCSISATGGDPALNDDCALSNVGGADEVIESADRGAIVGGGMMMGVPAVGGEVTLDLRLIRGLSRLAGQDSDLEARNQSISLMLGFVLGR
ncbi:MAG: porin family protein [Gemmatimonadota bacterium]